MYALYANASSAYIVFVKIETDGFYPFDFLFMSLKISDWNADHFFGGERAQKSPRGEGWDYLEFCILISLWIAMLSLTKINNDNKNIII